MTHTMTRKRTLTNAAGRQLMNAVREVHDAVLSGDRTRGMTVRDVEVPSPRQFAAKDVRAAREKLGVSVALLAQLVGVSAKLVEHWEQGRRQPSPLACRLLERIDADSDAFLAATMRRRVTHRSAG